MVTGMEGRTVVRHAVHGGKCWARLGIGESLSGEVCTRGGLVCQVGKSKGSLRESDEVDGLTMAEWRSKDQAGKPTAEASAS